MRSRGGILSSLPMLTADFAFMALCLLTRVLPVSTYHVVLPVSTYHVMLPVSTTRAGQCHPQTEHPHDHPSNRAGASRITATIPGTAAEPVLPFCARRDPAQQPHGDGSDDAKPRTR